jgi:uncharacterized integral membrane protein (TIGR00698 family)
MTSANETLFARPAPTSWSTLDPLARLLPGMGLAAVIGLLAGFGQGAEESLLGHAVIEALVLAILLGVLYRSARGLSRRLEPGVSFTAKQVLEVAIVLLGASVDLPSLLAAGPALLVAIVLAVLIGISASVAIGRAMGLNPRLAVLVAVGNSICGNSAIAAVAPVIDAGADDVASSIALTAVIGVGVVLLLPLLIPILGFSFHQYGVLAGMTVYAVPQVLAATFPVSVVSGQIGTLVKLVRVLMLGPVVLFFSLRQPAAARTASTTTWSITRYVPWFLVGFVLLAVMRSVGALPVAVADPLREASRWLTVAAMAALGLGVDVRAVAKVGRPVMATVVASLVLLIVVSVTLIRVLGV